MANTDNKCADLDVEDFYTVHNRHTLAWCLTSKKNYKSD